LGPDKWPVEFFSGFFDILVGDLIKVVEDCKQSGRMYDVLNSTFISLIPKADSPHTFDEFKPIYL